MPIIANDKYVDIRDWHKVESYKYDYGYRYQPLCFSDGAKRWQEWSLFFAEEAQDAKILDIGCGPGYTVRAGREAGYDIVGVDISTYLADVIWPTENVSKWCQLAYADILPFDDDAFDIILCLAVLEHIPEVGIKLSLKEMKRVLKKSGLLCIDIGMKPYPIKIMNLYEAHITLKPKEWWLTQMAESGFICKVMEKLKQKGHFKLVATY